MSLFAAGGPLAYETSITNMPESGLIIMSIVVIFLAAALLLPPILAGRAPRQKGPASTPPTPGSVVGGVHSGDGRSVAPHRTAPAEVFDQETAGHAKTAQGTVVRDDEDEDAGETGQDSGRTE